MTVSRANTSHVTLKAVVCLLVAERPSNMLVYLQDGSAQTILRATFYLTQSQYTDTGPTSPSADPIMPGAQQSSHWSARKILLQAGFEPGSSAPEADALTTKPARQSPDCETYRGFPTRMVYLYYTSYLRYTNLVGNPRYSQTHISEVITM